MNERVTNKECQPEDLEAQQTSARIRVRLPVFINDNEIGLGDAIKNVTYAFGIKPCGGCERRAVALNRLMTFRR